MVDTSLPIADVAKAYGVGTETLRVWINKYRHVHGGASTVLGVLDMARLKKLERENQDLRAETLFPKKPQLTSPGSSDCEQIRVHLLSTQRSG